MPLLPLHLSAVLQYVFTALLVVAATVWAMKRAASKFFVVDGGFESVGSGGGEVAGGEKCASCGKAGSKQCSGCKRVRYCSQACQLKHWRTGHQYSCKHMKSSNEAQITSSGNGGFGRHKSSRFGAICLVPARGPCNYLKEPKKILFPYNEFVKLFNWNNPGSPPCGLINCGNSCYANVVLQCLSCTRPLMAYLLERDHNRECVRKRDGWCFLCELQAHVQRAHESSIPFSPMNFLSRLRNIGGNLGYGRQEDAHEFMRFAIDTMQSICLDEFGGEKALDPSTQETTLIQYIFGGHLRSQVTCTKCNMTSDRYENMMDLTVEIHGDAESLEQCLDQFTSKEWLDGDNKYKCDGCNDYVKAWKRLTVHQAPNILTIALKRFQSGRFGKLNKRVSFPESLDLSPYMSGGSDGTDLYTLYAVVVHVDMLNASYFGHYICYTKDSYGQWYRIDDCEVMNVEVEDVLSEGAYMLLYSRISARKEPFFNPREPHRIKQQTKVIPEETENARGASPTSVSCFPTSEDGRLTDAEIFHLRDTKQDTEISDDFDYERASCKVLDAPPHEHPRHVRGSSEDMGSNKLSQGNDLEGVSSYDSSAHGEISLLDSMRVNVHPEISMCKVDTDKSHVNYKESQLEGDQGSSNKEASTVSTSVLDGTNTNHNVIDKPTGSFFSSHSGSERRSLDCSDKSTSESENSKLSAEASNMSCSAMKIDRVVGKALSQKQNGSCGKPKDTFLRGFLNKKYSGNITKIQSGSNSSIYASQANGYSNGHADLDSVDKLKIVPQNWKDATSNDGSFMSQCVLSKAYMSSSGDKTRERRLEDQCEINCVVLDNLDVRPQSDCSHGASLIETSHQLDLRSTLTNEISNDICNKDRQLEMPLDGNDDDNLLECEKPQPGYGNGHNGLVKVREEHGARNYGSGMQ